ncbi:molybdate ABC transporter substrate-binding protein [Geminicoccaceae bacterium 1502E]|nr:molybdate ABC transporter substrate-binding protein [Geminicoccaceae bacterium 1502E]
MRSTIYKTGAAVAGTGCGGARARRPAMGCRLPRLVLAAVLLVTAARGPAAAEPVRLAAAGSLRAALSEVTAAFGAASQMPVETEFAASGTLRRQIEEGWRPDVFASANLAHPVRLAAAGIGGPVMLFARNRLCALAQPELAVSPGSLLERMLDPTVRLGTSTPKADPSGDYAWELFAKAEPGRPGSRAILEGKALPLTGAPDSPKAPAGQNQYAWVMAERQADIFLTYCTNAALAQAQQPQLQIVEIPAALAVGADYGLSVLQQERPEAWRLAAFIMAADGQAILARHGFTAPGLPTGQVE